MLDIWDIEARSGLLASLVAAIALLADGRHIARIASWVALGQLLWSILISAPAVRIDLHWRSVLLYILDVTLAAVSIADIATDGSVMSRTFCIGYGVVLLFVCLLTAVIYYFLPLPGQCRLGGHYQRIGTTSFNVAVDNGEPAQITIQCWFPIGEQPDLLSYKALLWTSGHPQHQLQESFDLLETCAHNNKLPSFSIKHLSMVRTNSIWQDNMNSLVQSTSNNHKFPIAIYSHGLWGWRQIHHTACENLASRGFVVFACDHTPDSMCSRICAGASERFAFPTPPGLEPDVERKFFQGGMERRVNQLTQILTHMQSDAFFTEHPELRGKLDYDSIHLWGHSYGGGTISSLCCRDTPFKIRSAVMLDGWIYPVPEKDRLRGFQTAAMLHLSAELWPFGKYQFPFRADLVEHSKPLPGVPSPLNLVLRGSDHQNFVDVHMIAHKSLLVRPSMLGASLSAHEVMPALDDLLPAYFQGVMRCRNQHSQAQRSAGVEGPTSSSSGGRDKQDGTGRDAEGTTLDEVDVQKLADNGSQHTSVNDSAVQSLLNVCGDGLQPSTVRFIQQHVAHVSALSAEQIDAKAFDRVMAKYAAEHQK